MKPIEWRKDSFRVSTDPSLLQFPRIHRFLTESYWCPGIPLEVVQRAAEGSICFGIYDESQNLQIGFARVITDQATFAYLADVYVEEEYRGKGLAQWMMKCILEHPSLQGLRRFSLVTRDAHSLYEKFGFRVTDTPTRWMEIKNPGVYQKTGAIPNSSVR